MRAWIAGSNDVGEGSATSSEIEAMGDAWWAGVRAASTLLAVEPLDPLGMALVSHSRTIVGSLAAVEPDGPSSMRGRLGDALRLVAQARVAGHRRQARDTLRSLPVTLQWLVQRVAPLSSPARAPSPPAAVPVRQDGLTQREREVANLAAGGLSDREIAVQLVVSPRTVHTHLGRVYRKLGITGRRALTSALSGTVGFPVIP
jgi:DNA-binding CsgD family transcriptional regulator